MKGLKYVTFILKCELCKKKHTRMRFIPLQEIREDGNNYFAICVNTGKAIYRKLKIENHMKQKKVLRPKKERKEVNTKITHAPENKERKFQDHGKVRK